MLEILGAEAVHEVHNHHNYAWSEPHFGRDYWVIRKGCTPAQPGQEGFVGGSMGDELKPGLVDWPAVQHRLRAEGIVVLGGGAAEAPEVYKRLPDVLVAHAGTVRVKHTLRPLGVAMAGRDIYDPYKD